MMVEPPGDFWGRRVFKVYDGVFVADKVSFIKKSAGAMHEAVIGIFGVRDNAFAVKSRKKRGRARPVKTFVVIKNTYLQNGNHSRELRIFVLLPNFGLVFSLVQENLLKAGIS